MNDPRVIAAAADAVRVIVRRPHAYKFRREHPKTSIPGLVVLDAEGTFLGGVSLPSAMAADRITDLLSK